MGGVGDLSVVLGQEVVLLGPPQAQPCQNGFPRRLRRGSRFLRRSRRKETPGAAPLDPPAFIAARSHSLVFGVVVSGRIVGLLLPVYSDRFGTHFRKNMLKSIFTKDSPQIRARIWCRTSPATGTMWHDRQNERVPTERALKGGAGAPPRLFASGLSLEKAWIPPGTGREPTLQGPTCDGPERTTRRRQAPPGPHTLQLLR